MAQEKENRRVKLTKIILKNSLVELMSKDPISKISVKTICEAADINRSTFYAHYTDQFALLEEIELEAFEALKKYINRLGMHVQSRNDQKTAQGIKEVLEYIQSNAEIFHVLLSEYGDIKFQKDLMLWIQQLTVEDFGNCRHNDDVTNDYMQGFMARGTLTIIQTWLTKGLKESPEELAELITKLLYHGLSFFL